MTPPSPLRGNVIVSASFLLLAVMHLLCGASNDDCRWFLHNLGFILKLSLSSKEEDAHLNDPEDNFAFPPNLSSINQSIVDSVPHDVRHIIRKMELGPDTLAYVCCPKCFKCHRLDPDKPEEFPYHCDNRPHPDSDTCNGPLRSSKNVSGVGRFLPSRRFLYHDMKKWVGRLLCRPGMEEILDKNLPPELGRGRDFVYSDIWDATCFRQFKGPDGRPFFEYRSGSTEGRYVFSLCYDGFNPLTTKEAGKKVSSSAMYIVCLSLPPQLRHRIENIFLVGIIPGPTEPSKEEINHVLQPLVEDLLRFWHKGIQYRRTPKFHDGRLVRCVVIPLVCDIPAARQMAGFTGHSAALFCSFCSMQKSDIDDLNFTAWPGHTEDDHRKYASAWRDAATEAD